jgi:hypothetical protein
MKLRTRVGILRNAASPRAAWLSSQNCKDTGK